MVLKSPRMDSSFKATTMFLEGKTDRLFSQLTKVLSAPAWFPMSRNRREKSVPNQTASSMDWSSKSWASDQTAPASVSSSGKWGDNLAYSQVLGDSNETIHIKHMVPDE